MHAPVKQQSSLAAISNSKKNHAERRSLDAPLPTVRKPFRDGTIHFCDGTLVSFHADQPSVDGMVD